MIFVVVVTVHNTLHAQHHDTWIYIDSHLIKKWETFILFVLMYIKLCKVIKESAIKFMITCLVWREIFFGFPFLRCFGVAVMWSVVAIMAAWVDFIILIYLNFFEFFLKSQLDMWTLKYRWIPSRGGVRLFITPNYSFWIPTPLASFWISPNSTVLLQQILFNNMRFLTSN